MKLPQTAEYALRVLAFMAIRKENAPFRASDLSQDTEIPLPYLSKIMRRLVQGGLLSSQAGHGGGFEFAQPLSRIRFIDVLNAVDYEVHPISCVFGWGGCNEQNLCPLHPFWSDIKNDFVSWAESCTLADVSAGRTPPSVPETRTEKSL